MKATAIRAIRTSTYGVVSPSRQSEIGKFTEETSSDSKHWMALNTLDAPSTSWPSESERDNPECKT